MTYVNNVVDVNFVNSIYTNYVNKLCYNLARKQLCVRVFEKAVLKSLEISQRFTNFQESSLINTAE